jgi:hypothetical protein
MLIEDLIQHFTLAKKHNPLHANELLDYLQKCYIQGQLSIVEYKKLFFELDQRKAEKPTSYYIKVKPLEWEKIDIPG